MHGRFAPSPTGDLHLGNLRTALLAWLFARSAGSRFVLRFEDLDRAPVREHFYDSQRHALEVLGLDWDDEIRQYDHRERYRSVVDRLVEAGVTYPCYCTRREIQESVRAPHGQGPDGAYPGTCRYLSSARVLELEAQGRTPALRLRGPEHPIGFVDRLRGPVDAAVDDIVLVRRDGTYAYNLVVVVDDHHPGVEEVVRGDDLIPSMPRQRHVAMVLGIESPAYAHVPLVLGPQGRRLAKRDGAVTLADRIALGESPELVRARLLRSAGLVDATPDDSLAELASRFEPDRLRLLPWQIGPENLAALDPRGPQHGTGAADGSG